MKKVIVSGSNGFIGSAVTRELINHDIEVVALHTTGRSENLPDSTMVNRIPMSLDNLAPLKDKIPFESCDTFFHFAWSGSAGSARADTMLQLKNAQWTVDCLRLSKELGCKRFVGAGSIMENETFAAVFAAGNKPGLGYIYGSGKLVAHTMSKSVAADLGIELLWAQITNAYGPGERSPRFVNTTLRKIINGEQLQFTSGTQNYDFVYIDDLARAFRLIGEMGRPYREYIIGSSQAKQLREFILEMKEAVAADREFIFGNVPFSGINLPLSNFDCSNTENDTGFKAHISFAEGCRLTMDWLKKEGK